MLKNLLETEWWLMDDINKALEEKFLCSGRFAQDIERIVAEHKMTYIDAIIYYCEKNSIDVESVPKLVSKPLKEKLKWEAMELNFLKKTSRARLPLWLHLIATELIWHSKIILQEKHSITLNMAAEPMRLSPLLIRDEIVISLRRCLVKRKMMR